MKNERLLHSIGGIADRYISEAGEEAERGGREPALLRKTALLAAAVAAALLLCAAGIYVVTGGDLWLQIPSRDPEKVVREALENQAGKDYTVSIRVESVAVDQEETVRVRERFISGAIAQWRGWSDEYLDEHFVVVKAAYYAEYDHTKTTRSDGDVVMYFYLVRDVDSGRWEIVDNSGNMNLLKEPEPETSAPTPGGSTPAPGESVPGPEASAPAPDVLASDPEETVRTALEDQVGSEHMVGIQVESAAVDPKETDRVREELMARGIARRQGWSEEYLAEHFAVVKAFYCAEYDRERTTRGIHKDDMIEYFYLVQDADSGLWSVIDRSGSTDSKWGYSAPVPLSWQEQIKTYLSDLFTRAYSPYYDGLHYEMRHYEETVEDGVCTATFLWTRYNLAKGWDVASDEGKEEMGNYLLQATAAVDDSGMLDMSTISVMMDVAVTGPSKYSFPIEKIFPTQLAD